MNQGCNSRGNSTISVSFSRCVSALTQREQLTEIVELPRELHPWFMGVQFHPEFKSTPWGGHPLFTSFVKAALEQHARRTEPVKAVA